MKSDRLRDFRGRLQSHQVGDKRHRIAKWPSMKPDVEKKIDARVRVAFEDLVPGPDAKARQEILNRVRALVEAVWAGKIYSALPHDKTRISEYFLDAELDQMLNDAVDECYKMVALIAERAEEEFQRG